MGKDTRRGTTRLYPRPYFIRNLYVRHDKIYMMHDMRHDIEDNMVYWLRR